MIDARVFDIVAKSEHSAELVCFASGDDRYICLFAEALCNSIVANAKLKVLAHFHAINPGAATIDLLSRLGARQDMCVASTGEAIDLSSFSHDQQKVYYSVERFRRLPEILDRYDRPVLMVDLDQMIVAPLHPVMVPADVGVIQFPQGVWNILSKFSASVIFANSTPGSRRFFSMIQAYIDERLDEPEAITWHLDQAALAVVYLSDPASCSFEFFNPRIMLSGGPDTPASLPEGTIFWSVTLSMPENAKKMESATFRMFAS